MAMRTSALQVVGAASVVLMFASGCGDGGSDAGADEATPTATATETEQSSALVLEAGQTDEDLAADFIDALNTWMLTGQEELVERLPADASPELIAQTAMEIARENSPRFSEELLVDDFDERAPEVGDYYTVEGFEWLNAMTIAQTIDGHSDFYLGDQDEVVLLDRNSQQRGYKRTVVLAHEGVTPQPDGSMWIKVHNITEPPQENVSTDIKQIVVQFETDGDRERLASMLWG